MSAAKHTCKVVVVGTGAGGAVAGAELAGAGIDTILVEQGHYWKTEDHDDIVGAFRRMYLNGGMTVTLGNPPIPVPLGCAVGGTTIINSSTCFRPSEEKMAAWGGPSPAELEPCFAEIERRMNVHPAEEAVLGGNVRVMRRGCAELGVEIKPLSHNIKDCKGRGRCQYGCREGAKQSTDVTFVPDALAAGARLLSRHRVEKVLIRNGRAVGVSGVTPEGAFEITADAVVLALGALSTPAFLLRQGLANTSGKLGRGLTIHPAARVVAEFDGEVDGLNGLSQAGYIDQWADRGVMLEGVFMPPGLLMASLPGTGHEYKRLASAYRRLAAFGVMVTDTTTGRVMRGRLGNPFTAVYQLNQADAESMRFGMARLAEIYLAAGAKRVFTNMLPMPCLCNRDELRRFETVPIRPSHLEMMAFHPLGTCAMGASPASSVVNHDLEAHDLGGLHVMDGSVVPASPGVNPQITIMGLAMRAAKHLAHTLH